MGRKKLDSSTRKLTFEVYLTAGERASAVERFGSLGNAVRHALAQPTAAPNPQESPEEPTRPTPPRPAPARPNVTPPKKHPHACPQHLVHKPACPACYRLKHGTNPHPAA